jgi:class 3 adenylate cyclase
MIETVELGRDAFARHAWADAVEALTAADATGGLAPDDLKRLGTAAYWLGRPDDATDALERAFAGYSEAGQTEDAADVALTLAYQAFRRQAASIAGGWLARAERLVADEPDSPHRARIAIFHGIDALMSNRLAEGIGLMDGAIALAREIRDRDSEFMAMSFAGMARVFAGDWKAGLAQIDEAAAAASSGQIGLVPASDIYCTTIAACRSAGDLDRARQWADEGERWMRRQGVGGYPGICRVHRAELKMLRGQWSEAERDARQACEELERFRLFDGIGYAHYAVGEIRLRMGDLDGAGAAFDRAYEYGHDAQPGLALLHLARGDVDEANRLIGRALAATAGEGGASDRGALGRLLPAQIDIALAAGDLETAGRAVADLEAVAKDYQQPVFQAGALTGRGELLLGEDRPSEASPLLGRSWRLWQETDLPYEAARARLHYAEALAAEGETSAARRDLRAVRAVFERLGASLDLQRVDALLAADGSAPIAESTPDAGARRMTRTFMFTDIVTSTDLVGLIGDDAWGALLGWHDRELRSAFAEYRGEEVKSTGDGFFVAFERASEALGCAIDIQRRLARHRREHGFAPLVRIGLHTAEATREGRDYRGRGVHVAARIGAAAAGEEILISTAARDALGSDRSGLSEPRQLTLKGVEEPVEVRAVDWR